MSTSIGTELENDGNEMEDPKIDNVEEYQASVILKKKKNEQDDASIKYTEKNTVEKGDKSREILNETVSASITSTKKIIDTVNKTDK